MCCIAGIINYADGVPPSDKLVSTMLELIQHRGPDTYGNYISKFNHLGHARLSIIDLEGGDQPIYNIDKSVSVVFNGEIYNYIELKSQYLSDYPFYTFSDTEVIVALYEKFGIDFISYLNGQFAICLYDSKLEKTYLIRDRVGICPLFYFQKGNTILFASEMKSILARNQLTPTINLPAFSDFIHLWTPLSPDTLFNGIKEVSPGCYLEVQLDSVRNFRYWDFTYSSSTLGSLREITCQLDSLLEDAVNIRLRSDVPVAAYLSGGLDSTIILSYLKKNGVNLSTFSLTFSDEQLNEEKFQKEVSSHFSTRHNSVQAEYQLIADNFISTIWHTETPLFRTSPTPMMLLSSKVHDKGYKVVLTGEGADEVFGGYDIFKEAKIREFWSRNPDSLWRPGLLRKLYPYLDFTKINSSDYLKQVFGHNLNNTDDLLYAYQTRAKTTSSVADFLLKDIASEMDNNIENKVRKKFPVTSGQYGVFNTAQYIESKTIMPGYILSSQGDRMLMANSVEGRYPFLDHRVIEFAGNLRNSLKMNGLNEKFILKELVKDRIPKAVLKRPKQPYRAPDIKALMYSKNNQLLDYLSESEINKNHLFDPSRVNKLVKKALSGRAKSVKDNMLFTTILSTQIWMDKFINH